MGGKGPEGGAGPGGSSVSSRKGEGDAGLDGRGISSGTVHEGRGLRRGGAWGLGQGLRVGLTRRPGVSSANGPGGRVPAGGASGALAAGSAPPPLPAPPLPRLPPAAPCRRAGPGGAGCGGSMVRARRRRR